MSYQIRVIYRGNIYCLVDLGSIYDNFCVLKLYDSLLSVFPAKDGFHVSFVCVETHTNNLDIKALQNESEYYDP